MSCAVIIPYYQREDGILRRALASVFTQTFEDFRVIVVDDASPHPVDAELSPLSDAERARIEVIRQENKGPGGARNTGLDAVPDDVTFAAFLDSDDTWAREHLARAVAALEAHAGDVYFAGVGGDEEFAYHAAMGPIETRWPSTRLSDAPRVFEVDALAERMLTDWSFLHLSSMVMRDAVFRRVRFEPSLRLAAEDVVFFHDCFRLSRRTLLCAEAGAERGRGVSMFHGVDNTADVYIDQQFSVWKAFDILAKRGGHETEARTILKLRKHRARQHALWGQAARLRHGKPPQLGALVAWLAQDPGLVAAAVMTAARISPVGRDEEDLELT